MLKVFGLWAFLFMKDLKELKGIGPKRLNQFNEAGIVTTEDLLNFFPTRYEDRSILGDFNSDFNFPYSVEVQVLRKGQIRYLGPKKSQLYIPVVDKNGNKGEIVFFNQPYLINQFLPGKNYIFYGKVNKTHNKNQMFSPKFIRAEQKEEFFKIIPVYKDIAGIPGNLISRLIEQILESERIIDFLPEKYQRENNVISLQDMYLNLHFPKNSDEVKKALERIKFNEGLKINTGIFSSHQKIGLADIKITDFNSIIPFIRRLPFDLTGAQEKVLSAVIQDLKTGEIMNRMIEGDVGSGKTIIAVICSYLMALNGYQTAYMAPTEILARQHYQNFKNLLEPYGIEVELLTGALSKEESEEIREKIKTGKVQIVIGTHALIQESTDFYNLGLIITDEQHRFGVKQRGQLELKGHPHTLVMSATPIPRSLALTLYGDLDVSIIDEMPAGRKKVHTSFHTTKKLKKIYSFIENEIKKGHQAFIVCPFIEDSEELSDVISVEKAYKITKDYFKDRYKIESLHGKLNNDKKQKIIKDFNEGKTDILIATSIIEVGIDIPNVSVITILSADRFGLSQLHQLRGRTGRSDLQSYCFLVSDNLNEQTIDRMKVIVNNHNGHEIALADLKMRGPGDYFGFNQHGFNSVKYIDPIKDKDIFDRSKKTVEQLFSSKYAEDMICKDYLINTFEEETRLISMT